MNIESEFWKMIIIFKYLRSTLSSNTVLSIIIER